MFLLITLQTRALLTMIPECRAEAISLNGSLTERTGSVHSSFMEAVEEIEIGSTPRPTA